MKSKRFGKGMLIFFRLKSLFISLITALCANSRLYFLSLQPIYDRQTVKQANGTKRTIKCHTNKLLHILVVCTAAMDTAGRKPFEDLFLRGIRRLRD